MKAQPHSMGFPGLDSARGVSGAAVGAAAPSSKARAKAAEIQAQIQGELTRMLGGIPGAMRAQLLQGGSDRGVEDATTQATLDVVYGGMSRVQALRAKLKQLLPEAELEAYDQSLPKWYHRLWFGWGNFV